jgi:hypothetical protein
MDPLTLLAESSALLRRMALPRCAYSCTTPVINAVSVLQTHPRLRHDADYELLTAADDSSVVRCRIANSVHQAHEAPGRILAWAAPLCFARSPRTRPGPWIR